MPGRATSPIVPITMPQAAKLTLDNYYDLLKLQATSLQANEFLQLRIVAEPVDVSNDKASQGGYIWWSYSNLLWLSDRVIVPGPVDQGATISAARLSVAYGEFLDQLIKYVAIINLSLQDQQELSDIKVSIAANQTQLRKLMAADQSEWLSYCKLYGYSPGDSARYAQFEGNNLGYQSDIIATQNDITTLLLRRKVILNKQYADPIDKQIQQVSAIYDSLQSKLGYPFFPDYRYSTGDLFDPGYLSTFADSHNSQFDSRYANGFMPDLKTILITGAGHFDATYDSSQSQSTSMTQDWGASGSGSYYFVSASVSASEHTAVQTDFNKALSMTLHSEAAFRVDIKYGPWFDATLFNCKHVQDNPHDFSGFFGPQGSLLYYPSGLILVRGFSVAFKSNQNWTYDYDHSFSASAGGGFNCCGISFGASGSYTEHTHEHDVDTQNTTLTFADDKNTIRFVGLAVVKNTSFSSYFKPHLPLMGA